MPSFGLKALCCRAFRATEAACHLAICAYNLCVGLQRPLGTPQRAELHRLRRRLLGCAAAFSRALGQASLRLAVTGSRAREWWLAVLQRLADGDSDCDAVGGLSARSALFSFKPPISTA